MKLYYSPGACSLSPHIVLRETNANFSIERVDLKTKKTQNGEDFFQITPKGQVPVLLLDNGDQLTEGAVIIQYIADQKPDSHLIAPAGSLQRYHQLEMINFISTELHKNFGALFNPNTPEAYREITKNLLRKKYGYADTVLSNNAFIAGEQFSVADAYFFTVSRWAKAVSVDLSGLTHLATYLDTIEKRPHVQEALRAEGLI